MLVLSIELLTGVYRASLTDQAEWPPHPERVYSALVQAWSDCGCEPREREALEWLERQEPPDIVAGAAHEREAPKVFVPPNDARGSDIAVLPDRRRRQERTFRAVIPAEPLIHLRWSAEPEPPVLNALQVLAQQVASLGHSASLVRFAFQLEAGEPGRGESVWSPQPSGATALRAPYAGRLADLERWYVHDENGKRRQRPISRRSERYAGPEKAAADSAGLASVFGGPADWFVFEDAGGFRPDLLGFGVVARRLRDALMSLGDQPPSVLVSGHAADGGPATRPHAAIVPLANVGWARSTGDLLGLAVVLPRELQPFERQDMLRCLAAFLAVQEGRAMGVLAVTPGRAWDLERSPFPSRASLMPERWCRPSRSWASVTPVFLDRFTDTDEPAEAARIVAAACAHVGLPEPVELELHKHSAVAGAPPAYPARGQRTGVDWSIPTRAPYRNRPRRHVVLRFSEPVTGPILLGAARYHGLGMCLPLDPR